MFSAHSDDFVIGAGGTIAQYVRAGKKVLAVVFSYGEKSHPWMKSKVIKAIRQKEAEEASKVLGCRVLFFDLKEFSYLKEYQSQGLEAALIKLLKRYRPQKIFTHSNEDPHPDHQAVHKITIQLTEKMKSRIQVYIYSVWNPVSLQTQFPALYVDVSSTFWTKLKAFKKFPSQRFNAIYPLMILVLYRAIKDGFKIRKRFGEHFFRIQ